MALSAQLSADFQQFVSEGQKAEGAIRGIESSALKLVASLSGADQKQQQFLDTIGQAGGRTAGLGTATAATTAQLGGMNSAFSAFDGILMASGINVGKYARGLEDVARAAMGGTAQLGLLGTAGVVAAAGLAIANIIQAATAYFDLDNKIAGATARMMGWGDAARQAREAGIDQLVLATSRANREITNMSEALQINAKWQQENTWRQMDQADAYAVSSERLAAAQKEVRGLSEATLAGIEIAQRNGASVEQITRAYTISADGLKALADRQKLAGQMADAHTKSLDTQAAAVKKLDADYAKLMSDVSNANQLAIMEADATRMAAEALHKKNAAAAGWIAQQVAIKKGIDDEAAATKAYLTEQDALTAATDALGQAHTEAGGAAVSATAGAVQGYQGVAQAVNISGDAIKEWIRLMQYAAQVNAINNQNSLFQTQSQLDQIAAIGGGAFAGRGGGAGGGAITVNINAMGDAQDIGRRTKEGIVAASRAIGQRLPEA